MVNNEGEIVADNLSKNRARDIQKDLKSRGFKSFIETQKIFSDPNKRFRVIETGKISKNKGF